MSTPRKSKLAFSFRWMLVALTLIAIALAPRAARMSYSRKQHAIVTSLQKYSGRIEYERVKNKTQDSLFYRALGRDFFEDVHSICLQRRSDGPSINDETASHISRLRPLKSIQLNGSDISDQGVLMLAKLPNLNVLRLSNTSISDAGIAHLSQIDSLESLSIAGTHVTDAGIDRLSALVHLKELGIRKTQVTRAAAVRLSQRLPECIIYCDGVDGFLQAGDVHR